MNRQIEDHFRSRIRALFHPDVFRVLIEEKCWLAGGAMTSIATNSDVNDLDLYFESKEDVLKFARFMHNEMGSYYQPIFISDKSMFYKSLDESKSDIQLIFFREFRNPTEIFDSFDFTVCMGAYSFKHDLFHFDQSFFLHNSQRYLKFNEGTAFPLLSLMRIDKYREKGYSIGKSEQMRAFLTVNRLNIKSWSELKTQMSGMYGTDVDEIFDESNTFDISDAILQLDGNKKLMERSDCAVKYITLPDLFMALFPKKRVKFYKYVKFENGRFYSIYYDNFEYKIGEIVNGNANDALIISPCHLISKDRGIYVFVMGMNNHCIKTNSGQENRVLVELEPTENTRIEFNSNEVILYGDVLCKRIAQEEDLERDRDELFESIL